MEKQLEVNYFFSLPENIFSISVVVLHSLVLVIAWNWIFIMNKFTNVIVITYYIYYMLSILYLCWPSVISRVALPLNVYKMIRLRFLFSWMPYVFYIERFMRLLSNNQLMTMNTIIEFIIELEIILFISFGILP